MTDQQRVYHLALRELHGAAGAVSGIAHGWSLPFHYGNTEAEYAALRTAAVVTDASYRSRFLLSGTDALDVLKATFAGYLGELDEGRSMRTVALDDEGSIDDLVLISRTGGISYFVSGDAARRFPTLERLQANVAPDFDVRIDDRTESTCLISLAGPAAAQAAQDHLQGALPSRLQMLHSVVFEFHGFRTLATRTSDVGEDGFEFMVAPAVAQHMIETLNAAGVPLAGFEALETARIESCIPAMFPDLVGLTPAEADLAALLGIAGGASSRMLAAVLLEADHTLEAGTPVWSADGTEAGVLRSCVFSRALSAVVGLAVIETARAVPGASFTIGGRPAVVTAKPFYRRR